MTAADHATAVQLLRSAAADHLTHLEPAERDELVERIAAAIDRCARRRAAEELRAAADWAERGAAGHRGPLRFLAGKLHDRADALEAE
jgi:FixJ family two-component response regulator